MLRVSSNRRFLVHDDGAPFFYLGDTAWELFHRLTLAEAERYLRDRAAKGFTVIQAVALAELDGLHTPNANGDLPLLDDDPARPNEAYFRHVDAVVNMAASLGLHVGMLPTWGDKWNRKWGVGPEIFTPENARAFGAFIGQRYAGAPIIWILGGDRPIESDEQRLVVRAMAEGLRAGDRGRHLIGFHTWGPHSSTEYVNDEPWLDLHMCQSGHKRNRENWRFVEADYARTPIRPVMDAEPGYEDAQDDIVNLDGGYLDDYEVRKALYWALFAGAHGHTYGCWPIWCMWRPGLPPILARRPWYEALHLPGSAHVPRPHPRPGAAGFRGRRRNLPRSCDPRRRWELCAGLYPGHPPPAAWQHGSNAGRRGTGSHPPCGRASCCMVVRSAQRYRAIGRHDRTNGARAFHAAGRRAGLGAGAGRCRLRLPAAWKVMDGLVQRIVHRHGGKVSQPGLGATFFFTLG
jgi:hypothetical protein